MAESGAEKARLAAEQAAAEAARKEAEAGKLRAAAAADAGVAAELAKSAAAAGTGSVWNPNSYHWEEKPLTPWAKDRLSELIKGYDIDLPGGTARVVAVDLTGDASLSIRKGKHLVFFEFKIKASWEGSLIDASGATTGTGDGDITIPDIDQDSGDDYDLVITAADDGGKRDHRLADLLRTHGQRAFLAKIATFVADIKART